MASKRTSKRLHFRLGCVKKEQFLAAKFFKKLFISNGVFTSTNGRANGIKFRSKAAEHFDDKFINVNGKANNGKFF